MTHSIRIHVSFARRPVAAFGILLGLWISNLAGQEYPDDPMQVIQTLQGFKVEIAAKADRKQGGWISITKDDKGRIILGANELQPFTRLTFDANGKVTRNETIYTPVSEIMGMLWHDGSLYAQGGRGTTNVAGYDRPSYGQMSGVAGLHRLRDPLGNGSFSSVETLRTWTGPEQGHSDHGVHAPYLSPDGRHLYIINGNGVTQPDDVSPNSPMRNWGDDRIVPLLGTLTGRLGQERPPAGFVGRTDFDGKDFHLVAAGLRNALHVGFNADGEMFTFDSDMELELGVPWYRPNRVCHLPSGADLGYRGNSGKSNWYEDSLPPLLEIGLASPVGVTFGYGAKFPALYQRALLVADHGYGRIIAVHLQPVGSGYVARSWDNFVFPKTLLADSGKVPMNVTGMVIGNDGALYYAVGGRGGQSYLLRVTYTGSESTERVVPRPERRGGQGPAAFARKVPLDTGQAGGRGGVLAAPGQRGSQPAFRGPRGFGNGVRVGVETGGLAGNRSSQGDHRPAGFGPGGGERGQRGLVRRPEPFPPDRSAGPDPDPETARHRSRGESERQAIGQRRAAGDLGH